MIVEFDVVQGDATQFRSDVLLLKYAHAHVGLAENISAMLISKGVCLDRDTRPEEGQSRIVETKGIIAPSHVLFVGTVPFSQLSYDDIQQFASIGARAVRSSGLQLAHISTTIHGTGFGLDAAESAQSLVVGLLLGLRSAEPSVVKKVTVLEQDTRIFRVITTSLDQMGIRRSVPGTTERAHSVQQVYVRPSVEPGDTEPIGRVEDNNESIPLSVRKEHVFVAIPFASEFQDVYEFGIFGPVRTCGFICEKVDEASFTGDILGRIRERIETAKFVVADLTGARPNVYLEVGYAWGRRIPVLFLAKEGEGLHFDVQTHRCIYYKTIGQLARDLEKMIRGLYMTAAKSSDEAPEGIFGKVKAGILGRSPITVQRVGRVAVLDLQGKLSFELADALPRTINDVMREGFVEIIINLGGVTYADSAGLGGLFTSLKRAVSGGGRVVYANASKELEKIFSITGLSRAVMLFPTVDEAMTVSGHAELDRRPATPRRLEDDR